MIDDVLGIPDQLRDALWRIESARLEGSPAEGAMVCGMGGSAIGADLAWAALGERATKPLATVREYSLPSWTTAGWTILCSSYSGDTEETLSCFEAAGTLGARRIVASTGGALVDAGRAADVPVVGLPGIFQPRVAVAYNFVVAAEVAALADAAPRIHKEIEAAADALAGRTDELPVQAREIATKLAGAVPVFYGATLTEPVARRWKTQVNENAKFPAYWAALPEADHNELAGWSGAAGDERPAAVLIEDSALHPRLAKRFDLTAASIEPNAAAVVRVRCEGASRTERLLWAVMLGDLVSLELARQRGVDPLPIEAIERFKKAMGS